MGGIAIRGEDFLVVLELGLHVAGVAHTLSSVCKAFDDACFGPRMVFVPEIKISVGVCWFSV